jgi:hypothetical protein
MLIFLSEFFIASASGLALTLTLRSGCIGGSPVSQTILASLSWQQKYILAINTSLVCVQKSQKVALIDSDYILHNNFYEEIEYGLLKSAQVR